jgi:hypothetical protein
MSALPAKVPADQAFCVDDAAFAGDEFRMFQVRGAFGC